MKGVVVDSIQAETHEDSLTWDVNDPMDEYLC